MEVEAHTETEFEMYVGVLMHSVSKKKEQSKLGITHEATS